MIITLMLSRLLIRFDFDIVKFPFLMVTFLVVLHMVYTFLNLLGKKVQVGIDQEKAQSEKDSHSINQGGKKTKLTIRYLYHENIS